MVHPDGVFFSAIPTMAAQLAFVAMAGSLSAAQLIWDPGVWDPEGLSWMAPVDGLMVMLLSL